MWHKKAHHVCIAIVLFIFVKLKVQFFFEISASADNNAHGTDIEEGEELQYDYGSMFYSEVPDIR